MRPSFSISITADVVAAAEEAHRWMCEQKRTIGADGDHDDASWVAVLAEVRRLAPADVATAQTGLVKNGLRCFVCEQLFEPGDYCVFGERRHRVTPNEVCDTAANRRALHQRAAINEARAVFGLPAITDQPPPTGNGPEVWPLVIAEVENFRRLGRLSAALILADMRERDRIGRERYGTPLRAGNGRDALVDAYQEHLDGLVYMRQAIEEGNEQLKPLYAIAMDLVFDLRGCIDVAEIEARRAITAAASACPAVIAVEFVNDGPEAHTHARGTPAAFACGANVGRLAIDEAPTCPTCAARGGA